MCTCVFSRQITSAPISNGTSQILLNLCCSATILENIQIGNPNATMSQVGRQALGHTLPA